MLTLTELLLIGILAAQILMLLRQPAREDDAYKRRQRRQRIERIKAKVRRARPE